MNSEWKVLTIIGAIFVGLLIAFLLGGWAFMPSASITEQLEASRQRVQAAARATCELRWAIDAEQDGTVKAALSTEYAHAIWSYEAVEVARHNALVVELAQDARADDRQGTVDWLRAPWLGEMRAEHC